jgi:regulator of sigma E protease
VIWLVVAVGLLLLIFLHELGHFLAALAVGIQPRKFYVGFPPALVKIRRKGVEYGIGALPLGGYVRIPGMHRPAARDFETWMRPALHEAAGLTSLVQQVKRHLEAEDFTAARAALPELQRVLELTTLSPGARRSAERAARELDEATGADAYWRQPTWKRLVVISAGPLANVLVAFVIFFAVFATGAPSDTQASKEVAVVSASSPAAAAGLQAGDVIVAVNGHRVQTFEQLSRRIRASDGRPITVTVQRDRRTVTLGPRRTMKSPDGRWIWGFTPAARLVRYPVGEAAAKAADLCWAVTTGTGQAIGGLFHERQRSQVSGTVGIVRASAAALRVGVPYYLQILGLVSMSLALLNLLPLLPLDGGHIAVSIIEAVRRRALPREVYERFSLIGIALVLFVAFIALSNDLSGNTPR